MPSLPMPYDGVCPHPRYGFCRRQPSGFPHEERTWVDDKRAESYPVRSACVTSLRSGGGLGEGEPAPPPREQGRDAHASCRQAVPRKVASIFSHQTSQHDLFQRAASRSADLGCLRPPDQRRLYAACVVPCPRSRAATRRWVSRSRGTQRAISSSRMSVRRTSRRMTVGDRNGGSKVGDCLRRSRSPARPFHWSHSRLFVEWCPSSQCACGLPGSEAPMLRSQELLSMMHRANLIVTQATLLHLSKDGRHTA